MSTEKDREIEALKARIEVLEREHRAALVTITEMQRMQAAAREPVRPARSLAELNEQQRADDIIGIRALVRPLVEVLPAEMRAVVLGSPPSTFLHELSAAAPFPDDVRTMAREMAVEAERHGLTWAELDVFPVPGAVFSDARPDGRRVVRLS